MFDYTDREREQIRRLALRLGAIIQEIEWLSDDVESRQRAKRTRKTKAQPRASSPEPMLPPEPMPDRANGRLTVEGLKNKYRALYGNAEKQ